MNSSVIPEQPALLDYTLPGGEVEWDKAVGHLIANEFAELINFLQAQQRLASQMGDDKLVALLGAAIQICQACTQHQSEVQSHRQALTQSLQRQQQLKQQMLAFLNSTSLQSDFDNGPSVTAARAQDERPFSTAFSQPEDVQTLWKHMHTFLTEETPASASNGNGAVVLNGSAKILETLNEQRTLSVYFLGQFRVFVNGRSITNWSGNKCKSIFKHMVMNRHQSVNHEVLMDLFWPDDEPDVARRNLYQAIYLLRQALQQGDDDFQYIICNDGAYSFNEQLKIWADSIFFEEQYAEGLRLEKQEQAEEAMQAFEKADNLYSGDFLAEDVYEEWTLGHRERIKHAYLDLLDRISQYYWSTQQLPQCITYCKKILQSDNCREDIHRRLMLAYMQQGQRHLAIRQYHRCVETLVEELDVKPMPATTDLFKKIISGDPLPA